MTVDIHGVGCPVCAGPMKHCFSAQVLGKYQADYEVCDQCGYLRAHDPHWLDEAYSSAIAAADTGLVMRNLAVASKLTGVLYWVPDGCAASGTEVAPLQRIGAIFLTVSMRRRSIHGLIAGCSPAGRKAVLPYCRGAIWCAISASTTTPRTRAPAIRWKALPHLSRSISRYDILCM